jgi:DNA-directed RNA polymerase specialized sigma24 family protein
VRRDDAVGQALGGFEEAFPELYRLAYRVSFRVLGDRGDAEDVAQEALARAHIRWVRLHDRPEGWVVTVATNLAIDRHRRRRRSLSVGTEPLSLVDVHQSERIDLARALRRLPAANVRSWCCGTWPTGRRPTWRKRSAYRPVR